MKQISDLKRNKATWLLRLMLLFMVSTLLHGLIPFSLNRVIAFFILAIILYHDIYNLTKWRVFLCLFIAFGAVFTSLHSSNVSTNLKDWIYFATALLFLDFISEDSVSKAFAAGIEDAGKEINMVSLGYVILTLISLIMPGSFRAHWGGDTYYYGFTGSEHIAAYGLCLLAAFRLLAFRGKPFSLIDLCQLVFIMAVIFMTGVRAFVITAVIIVYSYMAKKIHTRSAKKVMYGLMFIAVIVIFVKSNMLDKFLWAYTWDPANIRDSLNVITTGRVDIWTTHLIEFAKGGWIEKFFGRGFDCVYKTNLHYLGTETWAQNDLVHLLVGSGVFGACVYGVAWIRFGQRCKKNVKSSLLCLCVFAYIVVPMMVDSVFIHTHYLMSIIVMSFFLAFEDEKQVGIFMDKKLNIAMFGHKRIPSREGGVEIVVEQLSTRMAAQGHAVTSYNRNGHHVSGSEYDGKALAQYKGVKIKTVPTINKKGIAAVTSSFFAALISSFSRADIVHIHAEGPAFMCWIPRLFGKRVAVTVHGLDWQREKWKPGGFASKFILMGEKMAAYFADEIIVLSRNVQDYFWTTYRRETKWIPNGVIRPECAEADEIKKRFDLYKDGYILFLGRLVPEKGIHYLIKAFKRVDTDKKLVIAGGASDTEDYLQRLKRLAAEDERVIFTGFVQGRMLEELYSNAYVYVLPSDVEGMPLSLLEAMSFGNCCLTSDIEECTEVIRRQGVAFRKGDITDLADKLQNLCQNKDQVEQFKAEAADYICQKYSWDTVVEETMALYRGEKEYESTAGQ